MGFSLLSLSVAAPKAGTERFVLRQDEPLSRLCALYCYVRGIDPSQAPQFLFRGQHVNPKLTAAANGLQAGDVLEVDSEDVVTKKRSAARDPLGGSDEAVIAETLTSLDEQTQISPGVSVGDFARMERAKLRHLLQTGIISNHPHAAYANQADADMVSDAAMQRRMELQRTYAVAAMIFRLWKLLPKTGTGRIDRSTYRWFCKKLFFRLEPRDLAWFCSTDSRFERYFEDDWKTDSQGKPELGFPEFYNAMYRFADVWSEGLGETDYCLVLLFAVETTELALAENSSEANISAVLSGELEAEFCEPPQSPTDGAATAAKAVAFSFRKAKPKKLNGQLSSTFGSHMFAGSIHLSKSSPDAASPTGERRGCINGRVLGGSPALWKELREAEERRARAMALAAQRWEELIAVHAQGGAFDEEVAAGLAKLRDREAEVRQMFERQLTTRVRNAAKEAETAALDWEQQFGQSAPLVEVLRRRAYERADAARRARRVERIRLQFEKMLDAEMEACKAKVLGKVTGTWYQSKAAEADVRTADPGMPIRTPVLYPLHPAGVHKPDPEPSNTNALFVGNLPRSGARRRCPSVSAYLRLRTRRSTQMPALPPVDEPRSGGGAQAACSWQLLDVSSDTLPAASLPQPNVNTVNNRAARRRGVQHRSRPGREVDLSGCIALVSGSQEAGAATEPPQPPTPPPLPPPPPAAGSPGRSRLPPRMAKLLPSEDELQAAIAGVECQWVPSLWLRGFEFDSDYEEDEDEVEAPPPPAPPEPEPVPCQSPTHQSPHGSPASPLSSASNWSSPAEESVRCVRRRVSRRVTLDPPRRAKPLAEPATKRRTSAAVLRRRPAARPRRPATAQPTPTAQPPPVPVLSAKLPAVAAAAAAALLSVGTAAPTPACAVADPSDSETSSDEQEETVLVRPASWRHQRWCRCLRPVWLVEEVPQRALVCSACRRHRAPFFASSAGPAPILTPVQEVEVEMEPSLTTALPPSVVQPAKRKRKAGWRQLTHEALQAGFVKEAESMHSRFASKFPQDYVPTRFASRSAAAVRAARRRTIRKLAGRAGEVAARPLWHASRLPKPPDLVSADACSLSPASGAAVGRTAQLLREEQGLRMCRGTPARPVAPQNLDFVNWVMRERDLRAARGDYDPTSPVASVSGLHRRRPVDPPPAKQHFDRMRETMAQWDSGPACEAETVSVQQSCPSAVSGQVSTRRKRIDARRERLLQRRADFGRCKELFVITK